ncbi:hypothetical protein ACA910_017426 [Epithemia clementina (nom. ined.)]
MKRIRPFTAGDQRQSNHKRQHRNDDDILQQHAVIVATLTVAAICTKYISKNNASSDTLSSSDTTLSVSTRIVSAGCKSIFQAECAAFEANPRFSSALLPPLLKSKQLQLLYLRTTSLAEDHNGSENFCY